MGPAVSRVLLDCCPTGALSAVADIVGRFRRSEGRRHWGGGSHGGGGGGCGRASRSSYSSAAAFAADGRHIENDDDNFVPLKATKAATSGKASERSSLAPAASAAAAVTAAGNSREAGCGGAGGYTNYGATEPVDSLPAAAKEKEVEKEEAKPMSRKSSTKSAGRKESATESAEQLDDGQQKLQPLELQRQQQQLQELQRMKLESHFPNRQLGQVHFALQYLIANSALYIRIIKGSGLTAQDSNGLSDPYVKIHLLPDTGKGTKLRTRTCHRTLSPIWDEEFCYSGVLPADLEKKNLRLTVLDEDTIGFDWMGEIVFPLRQLAHGRKEYYEVHLQAKNEELERSLTSQAWDRGKIQIGLFYAPAQSSLTVKIVQCVNLLAMDPNGYSDPFVKLFLKPDRNRSGKFKTAVKKKTLNPEFNEDFMFSVSPQELPLKTLEITVWDKDFGTKNDFIGALRLGHRCIGERWTHWEAAIKMPYQTHTVWHPLGVELHHHH